MVQLGSSSKPATVSIGGSSGKTTTTPAKSSSSTSSTAQKLSSLEKTLAPATQAKAPAPAPSITEFIKSTGPTSQPAYESEKRLDFQSKTTTVTPAKAPTPTAPVSTSQTPAQAIQSSIASSVNVPITPQLLAARNEGLKPLTPTSQLQKALSDAMNREIESMRASGTISTPRVSAPRRTPA